MTGLVLETTSLSLAPSTSNRPTRQCLVSSASNWSQRRAVPALKHRKAHRLTQRQFSKVANSTEAAQERWEGQVREGRVKNVTHEHISQFVQDGWTLLDVRPKEERLKASLENATEVPIFIEDPSNSLDTLLKKAAAFGMGGWWVGGGHMIPNTDFLVQVESQLPKDAKIVVVCQKGLRSLAACEALSMAGYTTLAWLNGGLDTVRPGEIATKDDVDIRLAGIGGMSEVIGWTEVQQEVSDQKGPLGAIEPFLKASLALIIVEGIYLGVILYQNPQ